VPGDNNHNVGPTAVRDGALNVFLLAHAFLPAENQSIPKLFVLFMFVLCFLLTCVILYNNVSFASILCFFY